MDFHIMNVEPPGSLVGGGESGKFLRLVSDSYAVTDLEVIYKLIALNFLIGVWRFPHFGDCQ